MVGDDLKIILLRNRERKARFFLTRYRVSKEFRAIPRGQKQRREENPKLTCGHGVLAVLQEEPGDRRQHLGSRKAGNRKTSIKLGLP